MLPFLKQVGKSFLDLVYPPICLHCRDTLEHNSRIFCKECTSHMRLVNPAERCPYCFSHEFNGAREKCCHSCQKNPLLIDRVAAAFDYEGPPATLVRQLKYGGQIYLAKGGGAFLTAQFLELQWPMPDLIVPMPASRLKKLERGYNQSLLLAEVVAKLIGRPVADIMQRRSGGFSQAGLDFKERLKLDSTCFDIKRGVKLHGKTVLLIDDVMTTGSTLKCCAEALHTVYPEKIYALSVCRAI